MDTQTHNKSGFPNNLTAQLAILVVAVVVLLAVAWKYLW